jgi:hypothetical protein
VVHEKRRNGAKNCLEISRLAKICAWNHYFALESLRLANYDAARENSVEDQCIWVLEKYAAGERFRGSRDLEADAHFYCCL